MKKREANFELLRIVAMLMILTLHYLDKGGVLPGPAEELTLTGKTAWLLEAFCVCAVNVYVLISAYFLAETEYRPQKALRLWLEVIFYSVGIAAVLTLAGLIPLSEWNLYQALNYIFPIIEEHYWFVTAYLLMILLAPLMNEGLRRLPKKTYQMGIGLLLLLLSAGKTVLPVRLPTDRLGYDALWFLVLYLIGAYIRLKGVSWNKYSAMAGYLCGSLFIFGSLAAVNLVYQRTGKLADFINRQYQYNSLPCLFTAAALFLFFKELRIRSEKAERLICLTAGTSFGVYLIHEHLNLRYLWPKWLHVSDFAHTPWFLAHWIFSAAALYGVCMAIDLLRQALFGKFKKGGL